MSTLRLNTFSRAIFMLGVLSPVLVKSAGSQLLLAPLQRVTIDLQPNETKTLQLTGPPGSLQVVSVEMNVGLAGIRSAEAVRRLLDLGRGGHLFFAVEVPPGGTATLGFSSGEHLRTAQLSVESVTGSFTPERAALLHAAGIAFALADSTRRHQPRAPDTQAALALYEKAAEDATTAGDLSLARWALTQKARFLLYQKSGYVETRSLLERAEAVPAANDPATLALLYKTLSSCDYYLGDLAASVTHGERALSLYRETGDVYWQGVVLGNLIAGYSELGRDEAAATAAHEGLEDAEQTQDTAGVVYCLTELANLYRKQGELQLAFQSFRDAQAWAQDIRYAPLVQAEIEQALGEFYAQLGLWSEAQEHLEQCLRHATANSASALEARGLLARTLAHRGRIRESLREYETAIASARTLHLASDEAELLLGRSALLLQTNRAAAALEDAQNAAKLADAQNSPPLRIEAALAEGSACFEACRDKPQAEQVYRRASLWIEQTGEREQEAAASAGLARVHAALGEDEEALNEIERALVLTEKSRASFASHDLAASYFEERHSWYALATDIAVHLDRKHPGQNYADKAFEYSERSRARAMLDMLGDIDLKRLPSTGTEAVTQSGPAPLTRRIAANQNRIAGQKIRLLSDADPRQAASTLQSLYREQDQLDAERERVAASASRVNLKPIASVERVQQTLLDDRSALISISPGEHATYRWVITRKDARIDVLPSMENLRVKLAPLQRALEQRSLSIQPGEDAKTYGKRLADSQKSLHASLKNAGALLIPSVPAGVHRLYLVVEGPLQTLPWGALRTSCATRTCYAVERFTLSLSPSASIAVALTGRPELPDREGVLVVSDTVPENNPSVPRWRALEQLPGSKREAQDIARVFPAKDFRSLRRSEATPANLVTALQGDPAILHLAAHTLLVEGHPELSGIALSAEYRAPNVDQGILWLHDIPSLHAPPLVVLSGCTTQGANLSGEELNTLTQALFYAGANQVVASSWEVEDDATADIMGAFYRNLMTRKMPVAEALRTAQLQAIRDGAPVSDWAAFLTDGAPSHVPSSVARR